MRHIVYAQDGTVLDDYDDGIDPDPATPANVTADAQALEAALVKVQAATTVAALRSAVTAALKALSTD